MLHDLLTIDRVLPHLKARCKREALAALADAAAAVVDRPAPVILDTLLERERLGSTGVGDGVAIPHGKLDGLTGMVGILARLDKAVDYEAVDERPVDLVFLLLAPTNASAAHLKALARVSRMLRNAEVRKALRGADTADAILAVVTAEEKSHAA